MKRVVIALLTGSVFSTVVFSQTIEEGKKFLYYERNKSALAVLQKVYEAKPTEAAVIYWLGMAKLANDDIAGAQQLFQQAIQNGNNDPLILVGLGHVQVLQNNNIAAKENFEKALEASKSKKGIYNTDVLLAIGRANADGNNKMGDAPYAVAKLKLAAEQDKKNPEPLLYMGINYLKMGREYGSEAVLSFREAANRNPHYAKAYYRIGRIFQVQKSYDLMSEEFDKAINADPTFALPYLAYFLYYQYTDVKLAKENLDKYVANSDKDCNSDYYVADYLYRAGEYQQSLDKARLMENGDCKNYSRLNILYAMNYEKLNDAANAQTYFKKYFATAEADKILPSDYELAAKFYAKIPGNEEEAIKYFGLAADATTAKNDKAEFLNNAARLAGNAKLFGQQIKIIIKSAQLKGSYSENDYFNINKAAIDAKDWPMADSLAQLYIQAFPDKPQGYGFRVMVAKAMDTDTSKGLAVEPINQYNTLLMKDVEKNKKAIYGNYYYLLIYYAQKAGDIKAAVDVTNKMMELYKEGEEYNFAKNINEQLLKKLKS